MNERVKLRAKLHEWEDELYHPKVHGETRKVKQHLTTEERIWLFERIKSIREQLKKYYA